MTNYVAFLRAVNVGGTGKLPMVDLRKMCETSGLENVKTYIASGNVVFTSDQPVGEIKVRLEAKLAAYAGKPVGVVIRTADEMAAILKSNPYPAESPSYTMAIFFDEIIPPSSLDAIMGQKEESFQLGNRELYVFYPSGMSQSKLKIPIMQIGTARNMNTVSKLVAMAIAAN